MQPRTHGLANADTEGQKLVYIDIKIPAAQPLLYGKQAFFYLPARYLPITQYDKLITAHTNYKLPVKSFI